MNIIKARAAARLFYLLYKLGMLSEKRYRKLVNELTAVSILTQMKEADDAKSSEETK